MFTAHSYMVNLMKGCSFTWSCQRGSKIFIQSVVFCYFCKPFTVWSKQLSHFGFNCWECCVTWNSIVQKLTLFIFQVDRDWADDVDFLGQQLCFHGKRSLYCQKRKLWWISLIVTRWEVWQNLLDASCSIVMGACTSHSQCWWRAFQMSLICQKD